MAFENLKSGGIKYVLTRLKDYFLLIKDAVKSVNGVTADENGDIPINTVPYAQNLQSELAQRNTGTFIARTSGGSASIEDGDGWLMTIRGNSVHDGFVAESIEYEVTSSAAEPIDITIDRDTFVSYVDESGTITLAYSGSAWSASLANYGIEVVGTPVAGDIITITYQKEVPGTITNADPQSFVATGWNLYDNSAGYAKVVKYAHGYMITGTYSTAKYAATPTGTQTAIEITDGQFDIPADGYIIVTGGNATDTAIFPVHTDWEGGYDGEFEAYTQTVIDLSTVMSGYFPAGLLKAGSSVDEINLNIGQAISRVEQMTNTASNMATAKASGREYEYDESYIYLARATAVAYAISLDGSITANDHGIEYFEGTEVPVYAEVLYGNNLKNKLERDVLTISQQTLQPAEQAQIRENIGALGADDLAAFNVVYTTTAHKHGSTDDIVCHWWKFGKVVFFNIPRQASVDALSTGSAFIDVPEGFTPASEGSSIHITGTAGGYSNFNTFFISPTTGSYGGIATRTNIAANAYITLSGCYIAT